MVTLLWIYLIIGALVVLFTNKPLQKIAGWVVGAAFVTALWPLFVGGAIGVAVADKVKAYKK